MKKRLAFAFFAAAILSSMIREWDAPTACSLLAITRTTAQPSGEAGVPAGLDGRQHLSLREAN
jgi:hypothetical protein